MTGALLLLETEIFFSLVYMSVFTTKLASAPVTELKKIYLARETEGKYYQQKIRLWFPSSNFFFKSILTWAGNVVIPAPGWQDTGVIPKSLHLFVCSNNNSILCSHPRPPANLPSQSQLEENEPNFKKHIFPHNSDLLSQVNSKAVTT